MDTPISVKRLLEQIKAKVEPAFAAVCVVGEVSNFRGSGKHWYFTLKEDGAALQCAVWASQQRLLQHTPKDFERRGQRLHDNCRRPARSPNSVNPIMASLNDAAVVL